MAILLDISDFLTRNPWVTTVILSFAMSRAIIQVSKHQIKGETKRLFLWAGLCFIFLVGLSAAVTKIQ